MPLLVSNKIVGVNASHSSKRALLWCLYGITLLLILVAIFFRAQQIRVGNRANNFLAEMHSALLRRAAVEGQVAQPIDEGAERVVDQYLTLVGNGALLTPSGWKKAEELSYESSEFSGEAPILVMRTTPKGASGRWTKEGQLELDAFGGDDVGSIDSTFLYHPPKGPRVTETAHVFHPLFTDRHIETMRDGTKTEAATGVKQWRVDGPIGRFATLESVIPYLVEKRSQTNDVGAKANIDKTISILKHLAKPGRNACAC